MAENVLSGLGQNTPEYVGESLGNSDQLLAGTQWHWLLEVYHSALTVCSVTVL